MGVNGEAISIMEGQLSFEDLEFAAKLISEPGRTAFLDESGSFGFDFEKDGVLPFYVVCAVVVKNENIDAINSRIDQLRSAMFGGSEMKSSGIAANHPRRAKVLTELLQLDFNLILLIADKKAFVKESPLKEYKESFVKFLHQKLYSSMYSIYPKLKIVEDEYGSTEFQRGYKEYVINHRPEYNIFGEYDFDFVDSRHSNIVQLADIIAGSIMQRLMDPSAPDAMKMFRGKIVDVINFPESYQVYAPETDGEKKYDVAIYSLAVKRATDYLERNKNDQTAEIRLRVHFLRYLLFNARMFAESRYIYADEIVNELTRVLDTRVSKDYLYRRIIAPLRDEGMIIASSSHGYKIPKSLKDITTYISQTTTVVGPMISRIGKCRTQILKQTDGELDILSDHALSGYRRFFGDYD